MAFWKKLFGKDRAPYLGGNETSTSQEFGRSVDDPVPCESIPLSYWYLSRLAQSDGSSLNYERIGSFGSDHYSGPIDGYLLTTSDGEQTKIFVWPYAQQTSSKAPVGLILLPPN